MYTNIPRHHTTSEECNFGGVINHMRKKTFQCSGVRNNRRLFFSYREACDINIFVPCIFKYHVPRLVFIGFHFLF